MVGKILGNKGLNQLSKAIAKEAANVDKPVKNKNSFFNRKVTKPGNQKNIIPKSKDKIKQKDTALSEREARIIEAVSRLDPVINPQDVNKVMQMAMEELKNEQNTTNKPKPVKSKPVKSKPTATKKHKNLIQQQNKLETTRAAKPKDFNNLNHKIENASSSEDLQEIRQTLNTQNPIVYSTSQKNKLTSKITAKAVQLKTQISKVNNLKNKIKNTSSTAALNQIKTELRQGKLGTYTATSMQELERSILDKNLEISNKKAPPSQNITPSNISKTTATTTNKNFNMVKDKINNASSKTDLDQIKADLKQGKLGKYEHATIGKLLSVIIDKDVAIGNGNFNKVKDKINNASSKTDLDQIKADLKQGKLGKYEHATIGKLLSVIIDKYVAIGNKNVARATNEKRNSVGDKYEPSKLKTMDFEQLKAKVLKLSNKSASSFNNDLGNNVYKQLTTKEIQDIRGLINQVVNRRNRNRG